MEYNITYRQKDKGWQYIISIKKDDKWGYGGSKQGFKTKALAKAAAETKIDEMKEKEKSKIKLTEDHDKITLKQFKEMFLSDLDLHREQNTIINYGNSFDKISKIDDMKIEDIEFAHIQNCINEMIKEGLEPSTIRQYLSKIKVLFKAAVKPYKIIAESPITDDIMLPKSKKDIKVKAQTKSELDRLLYEMYPEKDYIICLLASHCGMRIGEIIGLCEYDIDLKKLEIDVNKQWKRLKSGEYGFGTVKSQTRVVPIPKVAKKPLENYLNSNVKNLDRRIFPDRNTQAVSARLVNKMRYLGFNNSVHDLRHTYVTTLIANGVDFKTIAELIGDNVETVIKTYSHFTEDMANAVANKVNEIFL